MAHADDVQDLIGDIYDAALEPSLWPDVVGRAGRFVGGQVASIFSKSPIAGGGDVLCQSGIDPHYCRLYFEKYVKLDPASRRVTRAGEILGLTPREYKLLELLMRNPGRAISRDSILESVWGFESDVNENTLEVFVRQLRLKVDTREPKLIHTVRGFGYMMRES